MIKQKVIFLVWVIFYFVSSDISQVSGLNEFILKNYDSAIVGVAALISIVISGWVTYVLYPRKEIIDKGE